MGRNGAGKSTTLKAVMGLIAERQGRVRFNGGDISTLKPFEIARRGLGYTPEDRRIFSDLTVMENLDVGRQPARRFADGAAGAGLDAGKAVRAVSQSRRNAGPPGRPHERRRAADAHGGAHADGQSAAGAARRAVGRRRAADRRADGQHHRRAQKRRAVDLALASRTSISRGWCPTGSTCSKKVKSAGRARWRNSTPIKTCNGPI